MGAQGGSYEKGKSPYGIYNLAGNVQEWTADWYDDHYYKISPKRNPTGPSQGLSKVVRGGSWLSRRTLSTKPESPAPDASPPALTREELPTE